MSSDAQLKQFAVQLFKIDAVKFGEFKTKIGVMTPIYCDLRVIISYPAVMKSLTELLVPKLKALKHVDALCGVPYTAVPIATALSLETGLPMLMRRKEVKDYGTKKLIEGSYKCGDKCVIVEDLVTSGSSILETSRDLEKEGLKCADVLLLLDREQGGIDILKKRGITVHSVLTLTQLIQYLVEAGCVDEIMKDKLKEYLAQNQIRDEQVKITPLINRLNIPFEKRVLEAKNPIATKLFNIMATKQTNLCLAADLTDCTKILNLAEQVGPYICVLKTHIDILEDFHSNFIQPLKEIAERHNFLLLEDRKFADIGNTCQLQYNKGVFKISSWANLVTAHSLMGKGVLEGLKSSVGVFLVAQVSAAGSLITDNYTSSTLELAQAFPDLIAGVVCQDPLFLDCPGFIQLTPGVKIGEKTDSLGQQYNSPEFVVKNKGADVAVVGRGIIEANDPVQAAKTYRNLLWRSYIDRINC
ncbi:hypothetical protein ABEB36_001528 [Hypothenemus hampei]|uniref:Uridine 5'-monophosphate synthase n=1 Tax=Hypothenemus hampei TaxID=57062 RepID=A0ABD1FFS0_HYPHA